MENYCGHQSYDYRLKALVAHSGNPALFSDLEIPRTTLSTWVNQGVRSVVSHEVLDLDNLDLQKRLVELENENHQLKAKVELFSTAKEVTGWSLDFCRFPHEDIKKKILNLIAVAAIIIPLIECLKILGLSASRYFSWCHREAGCDLEDHSCCPHTFPSKLTSSEVKTIGDMVRDKDYAHFPIRALAFYAMRIGLVVASPSTWYRLIREKGWIRPRKRLYPEKPKIGIRASSPNEIWHIDTTILKLVDGTKGYIQACIDNFSRYVLAWRISASISGLGCRELLCSALKKAHEMGAINVPEVWCDSGIENINSDVNKLIENKYITRVIAQIDIDFSNSIVEAFFRSFKHGYLFLQDLASYAFLEKHGDFYIQQHNEVMPHSAFKGATPEEVYRGQWNELIEKAIPLELANARKKRIEYHQNLDRCSICSN
ncbi:MAG: DDE-type integrase/transposase/recombinase [Myxococcales bacterium]|nr:DDE-type integrase/transposase/recombinase [Myxococcales bacterium]